MKLQSFFIVAVFVMIFPKALFAAMGPSGVEAHVVVTLKNGEPIFGTTLIRKYQFDAEAEALGFSIHANGRVIKKPVLLTVNSQELDFKGKEVSGWSNQKSLQVSEYVQGCGKLPQDVEVPISNIASLHFFLTKDDPEFIKKLVNQRGREPKHKCHKAAISMGDGDADYLFNAKGEDPKKVARAVLAVAVVFDFHLGRLVTPISQDDESSYSFDNKPLILTSNPKDYPASFAPLMRELRKPTTLEEKEKRLAAEIRKFREDWVMILVNSGEGSPVFKRSLSQLEIEQDELYLCTLQIPEVCSGVLSGAIDWAKKKEEQRYKECEPLLRDPDTVPSDKFPMLTYCRILRAQREQIEKAKAKRKESK